MRKSKGMTLMEITIVTVIVGIMASFAIANYNKALMKEHERNAVLNLKTIHAASKIYKAKFNRFWPRAGSGVNLIAAINQNLGINILPQGLTYTDEPSVLGFVARARYPASGAVRFRIAVTDRNPNPCCEAGSCPSLPAC